MSTTSQTHVHTISPSGLLTGASASGDCGIGEAAEGFWGVEVFWDPDALVPDFPDFWEPGLRDGAAFLPAGSSPAKLPAAF